MRRFNNNSFAIFTVASLSMMATFIFIAGAVFFDNVYIRFDFDILVTYYAVLDFSIYPPVVFVIGTLVTAY